MWLTDRYLQAAHIDIGLQSHLPAAQFKSRALIVTQDERARSGADSSARAGGAINPRDVGGAADVRYAPGQSRPRRAEHQSGV